MSLLGDMNRRRGVQVYAPQLPARRAPGAAPPPRVAAPGTTGSTLDQWAAEARARTVAKEEDDGSFWDQFGSGLGMIVNNPVTRTALKPLEALAYPGAAGVGVVKEGLDVIGEPVAKAIEDLLAPIGLASRTDWENDNPYDGGFDPGDLWQGIKEKKGFGTQIVEPVMGAEGTDRGIWTRRVAGLAGDIATDPLSAVAGIGFAARGAGQGGRAARANLAVKALDNVPEAERAVKLAQIQKMTQEGIGAADQSLLGELGVKGGIRLGTRRNNVTVLEGLTKPLSRARGAASELIGSTRVGRALQTIRTPDELEDAYARLFYGTGPLDTESAITRVRLANSARRGQAAVQNQAVRGLRGTMREVRKMGGDAKRQLLLDTERGGQTTVLNAAFDQLHKMAEEAGLPINYIKNYAPHILTRDAQKFVRDGGVDAKQFVDALGMHTEDLFDPSGVTMARKIGRGEVQLPGMARPVNLDTADITEVNAAFREAGLKFDFYENDPSVILEKYINMLSSDVGFSKAFREAAERDPEGMVRLLTPQQLEGMADEEGFGGVAALVPDGRAPRKGDLNVIGQKAEAQFPEGMFTPVPAQGRGTTLTKRGKVKEYEYSKTDRYNESMAAKLNDERNIAFAEREALLGRADSAVGEARTTILDELENVRQAAIVTARQNRDTVKRTLRQVEEGRATRDQMVEWVDQIDEAVRAFDDDIRFMDEALTRDLSRNSKRYVGQEMRELRAERARLIERAQKLAASVKGDEVAANYFRQKADALADILFEDVRAAQKQFDEVTRKYGPFPADRGGVEGSAKYLSDHDAGRLKAAQDLLGGSQHRKYIGLRDAKQAGTKLSKEDAKWFREAEAGPLGKSVTTQEEIIQRLEGKAKRSEKPTGSQLRENPEITAARRRLGEAKLRAERMLGTSELEVGNLTPNVRKTPRYNTADGDYMAELPTAPGMADELSGARQAANRLTYDRVQEMEQTLPKVAAIDEKIASVKDPAFRQEAIDKRSVAAAQAEPRAAAELARAAATPWVLNPRRQEYIKKVGEIDKAEAELIERMDEAAGGALEAQALRADSETLLRRVNLKSAEGPIKRPTSRKPSTGFVNEAEARADELSTVVGLADGVLPPEAATQVELLLQDALKATSELPAADESLEAVSQALTKAKQGTLGRVVSAKLDAAWQQGGGDRLSAILGDDVVVHRQVTESLQRVRENMKRKEFWPVLDTFTNLFKTYAVMTPGFHVRNAMSAMFMNTADGVSLATQAEGASLFASFMRSKDPAEWLATKGAKVLNKESGLTVADAFDAAWGSGIGGRYFERGVGDRASLRYKTLEKAFDNPLTRLSKGAGGGVEGAARLPMALDSVRMGATVDDALERITRIHFDYSQISRFDARAKRMIPFWTFMSRNLPLQVSMMWTNPKRYAQYTHFVRNFSVPDEEGTPEYFGEAGAFNTGAKLGGLPMYLQPDLPFTRLTEEMEKAENLLSEGDPRRLLSDFNPMFTAPAEFVMGQDIYTGRQYDETDMRQTGTLEKPIELLGRLFNAGETAPTGERFTQERLINLIRALVPVYDRGVRLTPGGVTGGTSEDAQARQMESRLRFFGAPVRQLSPQQQQATQRGQQFEDADQRRVQNAMIRMLREQQALTQ